MKIKLNSKNFVFFLLTLYLCLKPIIYILEHKYTGGYRIFSNDFLQQLYNHFYMEQIVFFLTFIFIAMRKINTGKYLNVHSIRAFFLYILVVLIINLSFFDIGLLNFNYYFSPSINFICRSFLFIFLGLNIHVIDEIFQVKKMRVIFYTIAACYVALIVVTAITDSYSTARAWYLEGLTSSLDRSEDALTGKALFDYMYISDTVALLLLIIMSQMKSMTGKVSILFVGLFIILLSASRTSFICFGLAGLTLLAVLSFKVSTKKMILPIALLVLLISLASIYGQFFTEKVTAQYGDKYRFALTNYKTDGSYVFRGEIFDQRWRELEDNWLMGRYLSMYAAGRSGTYFHNWLSFWTNFGIVPFLLSVILIVSSLYRAVKQFLKDSFSPINQLLLLWSIFVVIAISFSRSYDFYYIWFVLFGSSMIDRKLRWRGGRLPFTSQTNKRSLKRKQKIKLNFG